MEILQNLMALFQAIIAFTAILSFLLVGFNALLNEKINPLKENQERMEKGIISTKEKLNKALITSGLIPRSLLCT